MPRSSVLARSRNRVTSARRSTLQWLNRRQYQATLQSLFRRRLSIESLELRQPLAGDFMLDPSFGTQGTATYGLFSHPQANDAATDTLIQAEDGKMLVAIQNAVLRYKVDGKADTSFGNLGTVTVAIDAPKLLRQANGKFLVIGSTTENQPQNERRMIVGRLNADGSLDSTFGTSGYTIGSHAIRDAGINAIDGFALDSDGNLLVLIAPNKNQAAQLGLSSYVFKITESGSADTSFGNNGQLDLGLGIDYDQGDLAIVQDNKILLLGEQGTTTDTQFAVRRLNTDGAVDTLFGSGGTATVQVSTFVDDPNALAILSDGKIIVGGSTYDSSGNSDFAIARLSSNGQIESAFGVGGVRIVGFDSIDLLNDLEIDTDGKIVAAGMVGHNFGTLTAYFGTTRLTSAGAIDSSLGGNGRLITQAQSSNPFFTPPFRNSAAAAVALYGDRIFVVGGLDIDVTTTEYRQLAMVAYLKSNGAIDTTFAPIFNANPRSIVIQGSGEIASSVARTADGKYVIVGITLGEQLASEVHILRMNADGSLDTTFSGDGRLTSFLGGNVQALGYGPPRVIVQADGKIVVTGGIGDYQTFVARWNANGSADTSFGTNGVTTEFFSPFAALTSTDIALQIDGKILVALKLGNTFYIRRYNSDNGLIDTSFNSGLVTTSFNGGNNAQLAVQPDGKIIAAGTKLVSGREQFAVERFLNDGTRDDTFNNGSTAVTAFNSNSNRLNGVALDSMGNIVVTGTLGLQQVGLARFTPNGVLDPTFTNGGVPISGAHDISGDAITILPSGKIVVVGGANFDGNRNVDSVIISYESNGTLSSPDNLLVSDFNNRENRFYDVTYGANGRIVAVGNGWVTSTVGSDSETFSDFLVSAYSMSQLGTVIVAPTTGLSTSESGQTATFSVRLGSQPTADVTLSVQSSDTTEATVSASQLTFTSTNWNTVQTITVSGVDDFILDGDVPFNINLGTTVSADPAYSGINADDVSGVNSDNDANQAPVVDNPLGTLNISQGTQFTFTVPSNTFRDPDAPVGSSLTYMLASSTPDALPGWLTIDSATRTISGTAPTTFPVGPFVVIVVARDAGNGIDPATRLVGASLTLNVSGPAPTDDFGDAFRVDSNGNPSDTYHTLIANNGARHVAVGAKLGSQRDMEPDGQSNSINPRFPIGDDINGSDEDGVAYTSVNYIGSSASVIVIVNGVSRTPVYVSGWVDFNDDGDFDDIDEKIVGGTNGYQINADGQHTINFTVSNDAMNASEVVGYRYSRFRLSTEQGLTSAGPAPDGEVEDSRIYLDLTTDDFGDAPDTYGTSGLEGGAARHPAVGPRLGSTRDTEVYGQPSLDAFGDGADEDAVTQGDHVFGIIDLGSNPATVTVNVQNLPELSPAYLSGWVDWDGDGNFGTSGETDSIDWVIANQLVHTGDNTFSFPIPVGTQVKSTYARFRLASSTINSPKNAASDGEVEDYAVNIVGTSTVGNPRAVDDNFSTVEDTAGLIADVLQNDIARPSAFPTLVSFDAISTNGGTITRDNRGTPADLSDDRLQYTPRIDFSGQDVFSYVMNDTATGGVNSSAAVTVNVIGVNDPPIAGPDNVSTDEDNILQITLASLMANDAPGPHTAIDEARQTLSITGVSRPTATTGSVSLAGDTITYVPSINFNGTETFTYTLLDSAGATSTGTVTVTVNPVNDPPITGNDSVDVLEAGARQIPVADLLANDEPGPPNENGQTPMSVVAVSNAVNGTVSLDTVTGIITFTPTTGFSGAASFQYTVQDNGPTGGMNLNFGTGTVNVTVQNFLPTQISGKVWIDETNDGVINSAERRLGGVEVLLTGNAFGTPIAPRSYVTLADGSYHFDNLAPGQYVVRYVTPSYLIDGLDVAGAMGDADGVANQFTINVAQPGGGNGAGYNFAVVGMDATYGPALDLLASPYFVGNPTQLHKGLYAALGADNTALWYSKLDGFDGMVAGEVVMNSAADRVQLTIVDANKNVFTASLNSSQFVETTDRDTGNRILRTLGDASSLNLQPINLATPPVVAINRYLEAINHYFIQENWTQSQTLVINGDANGIVTDDVLFVDLANRTYKLNNDPAVPIGTFTNIQFDGKGGSNSVRLNANQANVTYTPTGSEGGQCGPALAKLGNLPAFAGGIGGGVGGWGIVVGGGGGGGGLAGGGGLGGLLGIAGVAAAPASVFVSDAPTFSVSSPSCNVSVGLSAAAPRGLAPTGFNSSNSISTTSVISMSMSGDGQLFSPVQLTNTKAIVIDTTNSNGDNQVSVSATNSVILENLIVRTGDGADEVDFQGNLGVLEELRIDGRTVQTNGSIPTGTLSVPYESTVNVPAKSTFNTDFVVAPAGHLVLDGTVTGDLNNRGTLSGNGILIGNYVGDGNVSPGHSAGALIVEGNFTSTGSLELEINGLIAGVDHDIIVVSAGVADLSQATLQVNVGYTPQLGDTITLISAASITGKFLDVSFPPAPFGSGWRLSYSPTTVVASLVPNLAPSLTLVNSTLTVAEDIPITTDRKVADLVVNDDEFGTNTLALSGPDAASFEIVGTELFLKAGTRLDFETKPTFDISVSVDDITVGSTPDSLVSFVLNLSDAIEPTPTVEIASASQVYNNQIYLPTASIDGYAESAPPLTFTFYSDADGLNEISAPENVGTYYVRAFSSANERNNAAQSAIASFQITPFALTVSAVGQDKIYDGNTVANVTLSDNRFPGDSLIVTNATAAFNDKNVGVAKPISVNGIHVIGPDAGNYTFNSTAMTTANISAKAITGTVVVDNKVFDGTTNATILTRTLAGVVGSDVVTYIGGIATFDNSAIGAAKQVEVTDLSLTGTDALNYSVISNATTTASILIIKGSVFYNASVFESPANTLEGVAAALDNITGKTLLQSGENAIQTTFANVTNYSRGINGLVFDVGNVVDETLSANDFTFRVPNGLLPTGAANPSSNGVSATGWHNAPAPIVVAVTTTGSQSRIRLEWLDGVIQNTWLQIIVKANTKTGLSTPAVFYIGNAIGEVNGIAPYRITTADLSQINPNVSTKTVLITNPRDIDKNQRITSADTSVAGPLVSNTIVLNNITIPVAGSVNEGSETSFSPPSMASKGVNTSSFSATPPVVSTPALSRLSLSVLQTAIKAQLPQVSFVSKSTTTDTAISRLFAEGLTAVKLSKSSIQSIDDFFSAFRKEKLRA